MRRALAFLSVLVPIAALAQYDTMWTRQIARPVTTTYSNWATDLHVDAAGNSYVCGTFRTPPDSNANSLGIAKYGPMGDSLWAVVVGPPGGIPATGAAVANALAADIYGNIYVAGAVETNASALCACLVRCRPDGEATVRMLDWPDDDVFFDVAVGYDGGVYACGARFNEALVMYEYLVVKFDTATLDTVWTRGYIMDSTFNRERRENRSVTDRHPDFYDDWGDWENCAHALAIMPSGDIAVTGFGYDDMYDEEWWTMRFLPTGARVWDRTYHCATADTFSLPDYENPDVAFDIAVASDGNIYVAGFDYLAYDDGEGYDSDYNFAVVCYSSVGARLGYQSVDEGVEEEDCATSLALDNVVPQNVYVAGWVSYASGLRMTAHKFSHDLATRHWGLRGGRYGYESYGYDLCYAGDRLYVTGCIGLGQDQDLAVVCFTNTNSTVKDTLWTYIYSHPDSLADVGTAIYVRDTNNIYVAGQSERDPVNTHNWSSAMLGRLLYARRDVAATAILAPTGSKDFGVVDTPRVVVRNYGNTPTRFAARFAIGSDYDDLINPFLGIGAIDTIEFAPWTADSSGLFQTACTVSVAGDTNPSNNRVSGTVEVLLPRPEPASPADSSRVSTLTPELCVRSVAGADTYHFRVYESSSLVVEDSAVLDTNWLVSQALEDGHTYQWDCRAHVAQGWGPFFTPRWNFNVLLTMLDVGVLRIVRPSGEADSGDAVVPGVVVKNFGTEIETLPVWFRIEPRGAQATEIRRAAQPWGVISDQAYEDSAWVIVGPGDSLAVEFDTWVPTVPDTYDLLSFTDLAGDTNPHNDTMSGMVRVVPPEAVQEPAGLPNRYALESVYPNPFGGVTEIAFSLPSLSRASVLVYDAAGNLVRTVTSGLLPAGRHTALWDGRDEAGRILGPGVYYCRLQAGDYRSTAKLVKLNQGRR